ASKRHLCFEVSDLAAMRARLEEAGMPIEEATPIEGLEHRDPAGNKVEIACPC
ncbi:MAG: VOC family protein, partial [Alphaproteobacteria bacterium]